MRLPRGYPQYPWGDGEKEYFGTDSDYAFYFDGTNFRIDSAVHELVINLAETGSAKIYGGTAATDDLYLMANTASSLPRIVLHGNNDVLFYGPEAVSYYFYEAGTVFGLIGRRTSYITFDYTADPAMKFSWSTLTTTADITGLTIDASTNLTMGTNFGATGLKINVKAPDGTGKSVGIDLSALAVDFPTLKVVADAITTAGTLSGQIAIDIGGTVYYLEYFTHGS